MTHGVMMRAAVVLGLVVGVAVAEAGPVRAAQAIAGSWVCEMNGLTLTMVLGADGKGTFNEMPMGWSYAGTTLTLTMEGESTSYNAVLRGNDLELSGGDLPAAATFRRQGAATPAPAPVESAPPAGSPSPIVGTWAYSANGATVLLELGADGSGKFNGVALTWQYGGGTLTVTAQGQSVSYRAEVHGDRLDVSGGDLAGPVSLARQGKAAAPAARPAAGGGIVGTWTYASGDTRYTLELASDGNGKFNGGALKWKYAGTTLTITAPNGQSMAYNAVLRGDSLDVSGGDLPGPATLRRQGSEPAAAASPSGLAGVYAATESSVDPSIVMIYTQYVTLFPDGSVSYAKSEGGASRNMVTENLERFRSWHQGGPTTGNAGRWESDGSTIVVRWRYWNNLVSRGAVDAATGRFQLSGMGVLQEGATLTFKRQ